MRDVTQKFAFLGSHENKYSCSIQTWAIISQILFAEKQLQAQPGMDDLTDVSSEAGVVEDVPEMRPESPESEDERVEARPANPPCQARDSSLNEVICHKKA